MYNFQIKQKPIMSLVVVNVFQKIVLKFQYLKKYIFLKESIQIYLLKYVFKMYKMMVYNCPIIATSKPFPLFPDLPPSLRHLKSAFPPYNKDIRFKINTLEFQKT